MKYIALLLSVCSLYAKDFGCQGETFPIAEKSMIEWLQGKLVGRKIDFQKELTDHCNNPRPVPGIQTAREFRSYTFDPTCTLEEDIKLRDGTILTSAGTTLNPLDRIPFSGMLFIDGDDNAQLAWARKQDKSLKWILVKGKPLALEEHEGRPIYFDQGGFLTSHFHIQHVPARATQQGRLILIEEEKP